MFVDTTTSFNKTKTKAYTRHLLRESFRKNGRVHHRTLANLSHCSAEEIEALKLALRNAGNLEALTRVSEDIQTEQGPSIGATWAIYQTAKSIGIEHALGTSTDGRLAFWQLIARVLRQGSRLSAVRLAEAHAACDVLGLDAFDEDSLYANLDWLCKNQRTIEDRLFHVRHGKRKPGLYLYDVTSSYFEGTCNDLAAFGYNRDGKRGKKQMVVGLLCDEVGMPVAIELFKGNTQDPKTFASQIQKVTERWGGGPITFVGDRGMIKGPEIAMLAQSSTDGPPLHYITALTKPQIERLLKEQTLQLSLFEAKVAEVLTPKERYVIRRNPVRAEEIRATREDKYRVWSALVGRENRYLAEHPRAKVEVSQRRIEQKAQALRIGAWVTLHPTGRTFAVEKKEAVLAEVAKLDGCYALRTDLAPGQASKATVHSRYKDLALVESVFRTCKTVHLEMRPVYLRKEERTRGHALVVMMAYMVVKTLSRAWQDWDITVEEAIAELSHLCMTSVRIKTTKRLYQVPRPRPFLASLLAAANITLPNVIPHRGVTVSSKKKLPEERKRA